MKKSNIKNRYAIWIDHQKAIVLCVDVEGKLTEEDLISPIGTRSRFKGEETSKTSTCFGHTVTNETHRQHKEENDFRAFLKHIISTLKQPEELLILGPGDARHELQNEVEKEKVLKGLKLENRPADKMSDLELKDAMREYFHLG